jgi:hypothetical protein
METTSFFPAKMPGAFFIACTLFFVLQVTALLYTHHLHSTWRHIQLKSALVIIPWCFYGGNYMNASQFAALMKAFTVVLSVALACCLVNAFIQYWFHHAGITVFFYHDLLQTLGHNAIQFSILVFAALVYLLYMAGNGWYLFSKPIDIALIVYFIAGIVLLSSKLVIIFLTGFLLYFLWHAVRKKSGMRFIPYVLGVGGLAGCCFLLLTKNPVSSRFAETVHGSLAIVQQPSFDPGDYFNGVQFRVLQWRFVVEILHEQHAWMAGVSPADAQALLDQKYTSTHMYIGVAGTNTHGFLGYNTHNQLLESLLQTGLIGACCFIAIVVALLRMAIAQKNMLLNVIILLLLAYAFVESVFETQYGLILFTFLPLFFYFGTVEPQPGGGK